MGGAGVSLIRYYCERRSRGAAVEDRVGASPATFSISSAASTVGGTAKANSPGQPCPGRGRMGRAGNPFRYFNSSPEVIRLVMKTSPSIRCRSGTSRTC